jgi:uncharacterized membrane protein
MTDVTALVVGLVVLVASAAAAGLALFAIQFFLHGKREPNNMLWFLGRAAGPPANDPRPPRPNRAERRRR